MKSLIFTLCTIIGFQVAVAQVPFSETLPALDKTKTVPANMQRFGPGLNGGQRGVDQIVIDYSLYESVIGSQGGNQPTILYTPWELNGNFRLNPPTDTSDNFTLRWASVKFDSIVDGPTGTSYRKNSFNSMTIDSVYFYYTHTNVSGLEDTVIITIYEAANTPTGFTFQAGTGNNANMIPTNPVLWRDTIFTTTSLGTDPDFDGEILAVLDPLGNPVVVPQGKGFVTRIDYYGPKQDIFEIIDFNRFDCGTPPDEYASDAYITNSARWINLWFSPQQDFRGTGLLTITSASPGCDNYFFQNIGIGAVVTVDAPLSAVATATQLVGCPGEFVTLSSGASGGSGEANRSYSWSGNGNFTTPNSSSTNVELPTGNQIETYTVEVIDNIENTTVTSSVNVTVRGITVNLGNDTTVSCTDSVLVAAQTAGFLNGSTFAWSNGATTQQQYVRGGATYTITVTNNIGCTATDSKTVNLDVNQNVSFSPRTIYTPGDTVPLVQSRACIGSAVLFQNTSTDVSSAWAFEWDYGNQTGSVNTNGAKIYDSIGVYTVTLTASNSSGCVITSAPLSLQILPASHQVCSGLVGIEEVVLLSNINLYPNPNSGLFVVDLSKVNASMANVAVVDMLGKVVYNSNAFSTSANPIHNIDINNAANGIYFVRITADGVTVTSKISVAK